MICRLHITVPKAGPSDRGALPAALVLPMPPPIGLRVQARGIEWIVVDVVLVLDGEPACDVFLHHEAEAEATGAELFEALAKHVEDFGR